MTSETMPGPSDMTLRLGTAADAKAAAELHASQIGEGFLAALGPQFLGRLYRRVPRVPGSFLLMLDYDDRAVGFLAGSVDVRGLYGAFLLRDGAFAVIECAGRLLRSPRRVLETLHHGASDQSGEAELLAVAVDPIARGLGGGRMLVEGFLKEVARRGRSTADVVVAAGNEPAISLYRRTGFEVTHRFQLHRGSESLLMRHGSKSDPEPSS